MPFTEQWPSGQDSGLLIQQSRNKKNRWIKINSGFRPSDVGQRGTRNSAPSMQLHPTRDHKI